MTLKNGFNDIIYLFQEKESNAKKEKEKKNRDIIQADGSVYNSIKINKCLLKVGKGINKLADSDFKNDIRKSILLDEKKNRKGETIRDRHYVPFPEGFNDNDWIRKIGEPKTNKRKRDTKKQKEDKLAFVYCCESTFRNINETNGKVLLRCILNLNYLKISCDGIKNQNTDWRPLDFRNSDRAYNQISISNFNELINNKHNVVKCSMQKVISENKVYSKLNLVDCSYSSLSQYSSLYVKLLKRTQRITELKFKPFSQKSFITVDAIIKQYPLNKANKRRLNGEYAIMPLLSFIYLKETQGNDTKDNTNRYNKQLDTVLNLVQCETTTSLSAINSKKFKQKTTDILSLISSSLQGLIGNKKPFDMSLMINNNMNNKHIEYCSIPCISLSKMLIKKRKYNEITNSNISHFFMIKPSFAKYLQRKNGELAIELRENVDLIFDIDSCGIILNIEELIDEYNLCSYTKTYDIINKNYLKFASFYIIITELQSNGKRTGKESSIKQKLEDYLYNKFDQVIHSDSIRLKFIISYIRTINELYEQIINILNDIRIDKALQYSLFALPSYSTIQDILKNSPHFQEVSTLIFI